MRIRRAGLGWILSAITAQSWTALIIVESNTTEEIVRVGVCKKSCGVQVDFGDVITHLPDHSRCLKHDTFPRDPSGRRRFHIVQPVTSRLLTRSICSIIAPACVRPATDDRATIPTKSVVWRSHLDDLDFLLAGVFSSAE